MILKYKNKGTQKETVGNIGKKRLGRKYKGEGQGVVKERGERMRRKSEKEELNSEE
jgi:hypothetical protein